VPFSVTQKTLERLEWPSLLAQLAGLARTPLGRSALLGGEPTRERPEWFEESLEGVRARLAETAEARGLLAEGEAPPLSGVSELAATLQRSRVGGVLAPRELQEVAQALAALRGTRAALSARAPRAPRLAARAAQLASHDPLERAIASCIDPAGELRDDASPALADARRAARRLSAEIKVRLERILANQDILTHLSDRYFTLRNDRYVLPVRAEARARVPGIMHDASGSGTTLYIEPQALVELNNRHKQAELAIEREVVRVLRDLSAEVAEEADAIEAELAVLAQVDLAFARAALAERMHAVHPEVGEDGIVRLPQLRHPGIPQARAVPNDMQLGESFHVLVISGPNAGGKTVAMKAVALAALFVRAGLHVPAAEGARVDLFDAILADIGDAQSIGEDLSTFSAHMENLSRIARGATAHSLVVLDEIGTGTDPGEGAALAQAILEALASSGARVIATTHYGLLKELADVNPAFANASVEFDRETLAPTYRLRMGIAGSSSACAVAARMGLPREVVERAHGLLEREDRQLDRMLAELAASRAALESEQHEAARLREQTEATRQEYGRKLARLQERRDKLYSSMRADLDRAFREAHGQIAEVIRELQRGGSAKDAARARERLQRLEHRAEQEAARSETSAVALEPVDWRRIQPGDAVQISGSGVGVLRALPDRRGRVVVGVGSARLTLPLERVGRAPEEPARASGARRGPAAVRFIEAEPDEPGALDTESGRCDLRGLHVDEALDRLIYALDRAAGAGRGRLVVVHGVGTGALRRAVREHCAASAYVARVDDAPPDAGGDGVSVVVLA
jgi:DNA mismatch repair protein MutS2